MGWWKEGNDPEMFLGDEPFDLTRGLLKDIANAYREEFRRNPTLAEFLRAVEDALWVSAHEYLEDCAEVDVKKLTAKTARRKKRQEFAVGDYFAIPLPGHLYAFGRLLVKGPMGYLIAVFDETSEYLKRPEELEKATRLFAPIHVMSDGWENWRWRILGGHEGYSTEGFEHPCFKMGNDEEGWRIRCGRQGRPATANEVAGLEQLELWPPERVEWRIEAEMGLVGIEDIQRKLARGQELFNSGKVAEAASEFGVAAQYAQWVKGKVKPDMLREQALEWLRRAHTKLGYP